MLKLLVTLFSVVLISSLLIGVSGEIKEIARLEKKTETYENQAKASQQEFKKKEQARKVAERKALEAKKQAEADKIAKEAETARIANIVQAPVEPQAPTTTYQVGCENYRSLISQYDWNVNVAMAVASAESGCNPNAINWGDNHGVCMGSAGLFQVSCHSGIVTDPAKNVAVAYSKYQNSGWNPWTVCTKGLVACY